MCSFEKKDELRPRELDEIRKYCDSHHLVLKGRNAYPQLQRFRPHYYPWYLDEAEDQTRLTEGLEACVEVSCRLEETTPEELGFTEGEPYGRYVPLLQKEDGAYRWSTILLPDPLPPAYPSPEVRDDITIVRLKKIKRQGGEWACNIMMHPQAVTDEARDEGLHDEPMNSPFFPYLLIFVDNQSDIVLNVHAASDPQDYAKEFMQTVLETMQANGKPSRILVLNERTRALFYHLAKHLETKVLMKKRIPYLEEAMASFYERFNNDDSDEDDQMNEILNVLADVEDLRRLPDELLRQLSQTALLGALPEDIADRLRKEHQRRGL